MPAESLLRTEWIYAFLLVLARVGGIFIFVPLPGRGTAPDLARVVLVLGFTIALVPAWPRVTESGLALSTVTAWLAAEAALGIAIGISVAFVSEAFVLGAQLLGLQAGYSYASTIDPTSQADSSVLMIFVQLAASLLFFAAGLDRTVVRVLAASLERFPPGAYMPVAGAAETLIRLGAGMFTTGVRLAMPLIALLLMVDVALALMGRINSQLQLLTLSFPAKMLAGLAILAAGASVIPVLYAQLFDRTAAALFRLVGR
jgi:flagellar biosynthetic protein FliR